MRLDIRPTSPLISEVPPRCEAQARIPVGMIPKQLGFMPGQSLIETQSLDCRDSGFNPQGLPKRESSTTVQLQAQDIDHASEHPGPLKQTLRIINSDHNWLRQRTILPAASLCIGASDIL